MKSAKKRRPFPVWGLISGICILLWLVIPNQGPLALLDELLCVIILLCFAVASVMGTVLILKTKKPRKVYRLRDFWWYQALVTGGCAVVFCILTIGCISDFSKDLAQGQQTIVLEECSISRSNGSDISRSYWLKGTTSDGERITFRISRSDYYRLEDIHTSWRSDWSISIVGYLHTGRVVELR